MYPISLKYNGEYPFKFKDKSPGLFHCFCRQPYYFLSTWKGELIQIRKVMVSTGAKEDWLAKCTWRVLNWNWIERGREEWRMEAELDNDAVCPDSIQLVQRIPYQGSSWRLWRLHNRTKVICTVKYADDLVLLAKEETMLQGMFGSLIEIGSFYGKEMNMEKAKLSESQGNHPEYSYDRSNTVQGWRILNYLGSMITKDERYAREIKFSIAMAIAAFNKKKLFTNKLGLNLRKKPVKCYVWSIDL